MKVSSNNRASTVLHAFKTAVDEFGLPSCIRMDRGDENVRVSEFMLEHPQRGPNRQSVIAGRSVHNQRIERLWCDLFSGCLSLSYSLFYFLEELGILEHSNPLDLHALHFVFLPVIQSQLDVFRDGWSFHTLRTEQNRTPMQLWISGLAQIHSQDTEHTAVSGLNEVCVFICVCFGLP